MSYKIIPGVQQDARGQFYRTASWPESRYSSKTIKVEGGHVPLAPFQMRFHQGEGGHIWWYQEGEESKVDFCGHKRCAICGENGLVEPHRVLIGAVTKWDWIRAGKEQQLWPEEGK